MTEAEEKRYAAGIPREEIALERIWNKRPDGFAIKMPTTQHPDAITSMKDGVKEIDDTICNFPSWDKPKWDPYDFCGNTHAMMAGAKAIDDSHRKKGIEQTHTWDSTTTTSYHRNWL